MRKYMQSRQIRLKLKQVKRGWVWCAWKDFVAAHWRPRLLATDVSAHGGSSRPQRGNWDEC